MAPETELPKRLLPTDRILSAVWVGLVVYFSLKSLTLCYTELPSFDGALNLQIPITLVNTGKYASSYHEVTVFDHYAVHTGPTVLLPTALVLLVSGVSPFTAQLVSAVYLILFLALVSFYVRSLTGSWLPTSLALLLICATPFFFPNAHHVQGEIPALFFFVGGLMLLDQEGEKRPNIRMVGAGACLGLAYLTKTVMLIAAPTVAVAMAYAIWIRKSVTWRNVAVFVGGFLAVAGLFECFRAAQLGDDYFAWWQVELADLMDEGGMAAGVPDSEQGIVGRVVEHLGLLQQQLLAGRILSVLYIGSLLAVGACGAVWTKRNPRRLRLSAIIIVCTVVLYFTWWLGITPTDRAWPRRLLQGIVLYHVALVCGLWIFTAQLWPRRRSPRVLAMSYLVILFVGMAWTSPRALRIEFKASADYNRAAILAAGMSRLPRDTTFYGVGWWQAPKISFLLGKSFRDLDQSELAEFPDEEASAYLVVDPEAVLLGRQTLKRVAAEYNLERVGIYGLYSLHRIRSRRSPAQMPPSNTVGF